MSKGKVTRLSEIKMRNESRERKDIIDQVKTFPQLVNQYDVTGYAVVFFHRDGGASAYWDTECLGPASIMRSDLAKRVLDRVEAQQDTDEVLDDLFDE